MRNWQTGFVWHELFMWHDNRQFAGVLPAVGALEPDDQTEHPLTKRRIKNLMDVAGLTEQLTPIKPRHATDEEILWVHTGDYVERLKKLSADQGGDARVGIPYGHTFFGPGGWEIATLAAGGVIEAVDAVITGKVRNAYALVRPIGHHAEPDTGMGFCILNNGAIAAHHARKRHGIERIAFVDWDVHHGNGAQRIFWNERDVLTISIHQDRMFPPMSGGLDEIGEGAGRGSNINIPLPPGSGVGAYEAAFERVIIPALYKFKPDLIIVPSGFDAGAMDMLARMMVHGECFRFMTRRLMEAAGDLCEHRLALCHEGGYHRTTTPFFALAVIEQLSGIKTEIEDPHFPIFAGMGQQELQPHQDALITASERLLAHIPGR
jgi:acetoin utilization deacetylase AcuC-like enzyme